MTTIRQCLSFLTALVLAFLCIGAVTPAEAANGDFGLVYNSPSVNLRSQPNQYADWLGSYTTGTWLEINGETGNWYHVTGPDGKKNVSIIAVYDIDGASGTIKSDPNLSFRITSSTYSDLFEIESCGVSSDGKLYFNANRRKSASDHNHDAIMCFKEYKVK